MINFLNKKYVSSSYFCCIHRYLKKSRLLKFWYVPATRAAFYKYIFVMTINSTDQTNKASSMWQHSHVWTPVDQNNYLKPPQASIALNYWKVKLSLKILKFWAPDVCWERGFKNNNYLFTSPIKCQAGHHVF